MLPDLRLAVAGPLAEAVSGLDSLQPGDAFDARIPDAIVSAGLHRLPVPADAGGLGASMSEAAEVLAALGAIDGSAALGFAMHVHSVGSIAESGGWTPALRASLYQSIVDDGALVNNASTEEGGGSPARGAIPGTVARPDSSGGWGLTGEKTWTTWLPALRHAVVTARIEDDPGDAADATAIELGTFLVDLELPGVERRPSFKALGMRASASGRLVLDDVCIPGDALVTRRAAGEPDARGAAPGAWFAMAVAATYLGVGEGARTAVARWALDRRPGDGATAVADIPTVQLRLGRLDAVLRVARITLLHATAQWDAASGDPATQARFGPDLALAKLTATNAAVTATDEALRIAGGPGFLAGRLERAFRDARAGLINPPLDDIALTGFGRAVLEASR